jgi:DNA-binding transcriptional MerR regulator
VDGLLIGIAARETGLTSHTLRYYEEAGAIPAIARDDTGRRRYSPADLAWIEYAACLRSLGMGIADIAAYVDAARRDDGECEQIEMLRDHVERMKTQRIRLDGYIVMAEGKLAGKVDRR